MPTMAWGAIVIVLFSLFIFVMIWRIRPWWQKLGAMTLLLIGMAFAGFQFLFPFNGPIQTTGPGEVVTDTIYFEHATAFGEMATGESQREIPVKLWWPDSAGDTQHPLVIFSHGSFGVAESNESLFLELASHGYAVASLDHPHHSFTTTLSDGETVNVDPSFLQSVLAAQGTDDLAGALESFNQWQGIRVEDINFVVDSFLAGETHEDYFGSIDPDAILLAGHSLGGSAVLEVGRERPEDFRGVISLEAPFFGDITGVADGEYVFVEEDYPLPVLHFYSDALWGKLDDIPTYEMNQRLIEIDSPQFVNVHIEGSGHIGLTDMSLVSPVLTNLFDGGLNTKPADEKLAEINQATLEFLEGGNFEIN